MHVPTSPGGPHPNGRTPSTPPTPGPGATPQPADSGRDTYGHFAGGPFARQVAALRHALLAPVTEDDMEAVARELVRQAKEGNLAAAKLLLSYALASWRCAS
jgi:hypothetical protein